MPRMFGAKFPLEVKREKIVYSAADLVIGANLTRYLGCCGLTGEYVGYAWATETPGATFLILRNGVLRNLVVTSKAAPGAGQTFIYTVRVNGVATALTVTLSGAAAVNGSDLVNSVRVVVGDRVSVQLVTSAASSATNHTADLSYNMNMIRPIYNDLNWCSQTGTIAAGSTKFLPSGCRVPLGSPTFPTAETDNRANYLVVQKGTIRTLVVLASAAAGAAQSFVYTVRLNGVATALTVTVSGAAQITGADTTNVISVAAGDRATLQVVTSGGAAAAAHQASFDFEEGDYRAG